VAAGIAADWLLGEPPASWHPVAGFGRTMLWLEDRWYADSRWRGAVHAAAGTALAAGAGWLLSGGGRPRTAEAVRAGTEGRRTKRPGPVETAPTAARLPIGAVPTAPRQPVRTVPTSARQPPRPGASLRPVIALALATYVAVAARALHAAASQVAISLEDGDLDAARARLPALVGRDPAGLDAAEVTRAVVESVAENTVDAVIAPAWWAALAGPAGVLAYRAVNTLDAMVGHRSPRYARFGWAAARADDLAGWVPARLTAVLVAAVRPRTLPSVLTAVRDQAPAHPSPNAGVAEAAFGAALGVRLGGTNVYDGRAERRGALGTGPPPRVADIPRAVRLSRDVTAAAAIIGLVLWGRSGKR
jgi:adenosylcobinamide-phosphate synthase